MIQLLSDSKIGKDNFIFEKTLQKQGYRSIAGCDEVGRGPLAGPVVAAAVVLPPSIDPSIYLDSKVLSHRKRELLSQTLVDCGARIGLAFVPEAEIETPTLFIRGELSNYNLDEDYNCQSTTGQFHGENA